MGVRVSFQFGITIDEPPTWTRFLSLAAHVLDRTN